MKWSWSSTLPPNPVGVVAECLSADVADCRVQELLRLCTRERLVALRDLHHDVLPLDELTHELDVAVLADEGLVLTRLRVSVRSADSVALEDGDFGDDVGADGDRLVQSRAECLRSGAVCAEVLVVRKQSLEVRLEVGVNDDGGAAGELPVPELEERAGLGHSPDDRVEVLARADALVLLQRALELEVAEAALAEERSLLMFGDAGGEAREVLDGGVVLVEVEQVHLRFVLVRAAGDEDGIGLESVLVVESEDVDFELVDVPLDLRDARRLDGILKIVESVVWEVLLVLSGSSGMPQGECEVRRRLHRRSTGRRCSARSQCTSSRRVCGAALCIRGRRAGCTSRRSSRSR